MRTMTIFTLLLLAGCGPVGPLDSNAAEEFGDVFLYFINANPGAETMTIGDSSGRIARDLGFGERSYVDGSCPEGQNACVPHLVDRTDGVFKTKFDRARGTLDVREELRAMYPQETGTVIVTGPEQGLVVRHPQSISETCGLAVVNALAVGDLATDPGRYDIAIELKGTPEQGGFFDETETPFVGPCGELPIDTPEQRQLHAELLMGREALREAVADSPWFYPVSCAAGSCLAWGIPAADERSALASDGTVQSYRDSRSYFGCVEDAMTATTCSESPSWDDVTVDAAAVADCAEPVAVQTPMVVPQSVGRWEDDGLCEATFRVRTPGRDVVFGPRDDDPGHHADGALIEDTTSDAGGRVGVSQGGEVNWVLYGRPVNPRIWRWSSSDQFVDLSAFPTPD